MSVQAQIVTDSRDSALVVPSKAIHAASGGKERAVDVLGADGRLATRTVQTGLAAGQLTEVVGGLQEGDKVVVASGFAR